MQQQKLAKEKMAIRNLRYNNYFQSDRTESPRKKQNEALKEEEDR